MHFKYYFLLITFFSGLAVLPAQSLKRFKLKAVEAYEAKDFSRALEYYQMIINEAEDETAENYYNAGEAARSFRIYGLAEQYYRQVLMDSVARQTYPLTNYNLGLVLKNQGRYDEAVRYFNNYLQQAAATQDAVYVDKAKKEIADSEWAAALPIAAIRINQKDSTINTANSEFSPIVLGDDLYYSSVRYNTDEDYKPEAPLTRIFVTKNGALGQLATGELNEDLKHSAHATFNADASRIYYTICESVNAIDIRCDLHYRTKVGEDWGDRVSLSGINKEGFTSTQPAIGFDKKAGKEVLFFASDRPSEEGDTLRDLNIWCSYLSDGTFGAPFLLDEINTEEDDITPFFNDETQTLYFSSNGRQNMGGFDIYSMQRTAEGWSEIDHMGAPINTSYDDVYYSTNKEATMAYLSSNRPGATCNEENDLCGCNDIYEIPLIKIKVLTFNAITKEPLSGTEVTLEQLQKQLKDIQTKPDDYRYDYNGEFDIDYRVDASLDGYVPDDSLFNTLNLKGGSIIEIPLYLRPAVEVDVMTYNKISGKPLPGAKVELYEVPQEDLFTDLSLLDSKQEKASISYNYPLNFGKKYMITASKPGYSRDTSYRTITEDIPIVPTKLLDELRLCKTPPGPELVRLYFYNDEPDRATRRPTTEWSYERAFDSYLDLQPEFIRDFVSEPEELSKIERFFENDVKGGYEDLKEFTRLIKSYLDEMEDGEELIVMIRGYASPRARNDYNLNLTKRRIMSIQNYFDNAGLLREYVGRIRVEEEANGEEKAPKDIIDDIADRKNSIYSVAASKERRVEITRVLIAPESCDEVQK